MLHLSPLRMAINDMGIDLLAPLVGGGVDHGIRLKGALREENSFFSLLLYMYL